MRTRAQTRALRDAIAELPDGPKAYAVASLAATAAEQAETLASRLDALATLAGEEGATEAVEALEDAAGWVRQAIVDALHAQEDLMG